jgi:two-component system, NarL family, nitrate/nitrite response regulator NarL
MALQVLIADGNEVARRFAARVVREAFSDEIDLTACPSADDAIERLAALDASAATRTLVLFDIDLPADGALRLLGALAGTPALRVVTTLYADDEAIFPMLCAGADGFLLKEDRYEVLVEQVQRLARGEPPISPGLARLLLAHFAPGTPAAGALSTEESALLGHLAKGFTRREIAQQMRIGTAGAARLVGSVYRKLHAAPAAA